MSRRGGIGAVKALIRRVGLEEFARRVEITEATARRWLRDGPSASGREDVVEANARSERAIRAAETRAEHAEEERKAEARRAAARREAWRTRRVDEGRETILRNEGLIFPNGLTITGRNGRTRTTLAEMLHRSDPAWIAFLELAERNGRTEKEAKYLWFSPNAKKKKSKIGGRKRKSNSRRKGRKK